MARQFSGSKSCVKERHDTFQYVPFFSTLKQLLHDESVLEQIEQSPNRIHTDGFIEDICDGSVFHAHPLFSTQPSALQIIAYYNEVEMCNPIGSHIKKHKLGVVFYTIGNIHPKYRSSLRAINLALVATVPIIEQYGINEILQPFLSDIEILQTSGVKVSIKGVEHTFKGALYWHSWQIISPATPLEDLNYHFHFRFVIVGPALFQILRFLAVSFRKVLCIEQRIIMKNNASYYKGLLMSIILKHTVLILGHVFWMLHTFPCLMVVCLMMPCMTY